ncbi:apolipoprotein C-III [Anolis carolinensis]|uniref:apolipoprotein C-III n=1 Tax=Anolis carolinensis TaxID=28377 RepID=UPI0004626A47|nr:PREDICTED: apolipoprotein C-III [Anolis carolinensis]|eukprot:XP_008121791.1 PREDICTED: apolipoprotein C-III [Anolis carolinensis]
MKGPLLLLLVLLALVASFARAEAPAEESLVEKVQVYVQQVAQKAQEHMVTLRESPTTQQARAWLQAGLAQTQEYFGQLKDQLATLWEKTTAGGA